MPNTGHGGTLLKGHRPSDAGSGLSTEAYRQRHEITFSVSANLEVFEMQPPKLIFHFFLELIRGFALF